MSNPRVWVFSVADDDETGVLAVLPESDEATARVWFTSKKGSRPRLELWDVGGGCVQVIE